MTRPPITEQREMEIEDVKADARRALFRAVRSAFKRESEAGRIRAKDLAASIGSDPSYVSRVLTGTAGGITAETAAVFLDALGYHLQMTALRRADIPVPNWDCRADLPAVPHYDYHSSTPSLKSTRNDSKIIKMVLEPTSAG